MPENVTIFDELFQEILFSALNVLIILCVSVFLWEFTSLLWTYFCCVKAIRKSSPTGLSGIYGGLDLRQEILGFWDFRRI
jgi:hypothetical protein